MLSSATDGAGTGPWECQPTERRLEAKERKAADCCLRSLHPQTGTDSTCPRSPGSISGRHVPSRQRLYMRLRDKTASDLPKRE